MASEQGYFCRHCWDRMCGACALLANEWKNLALRRAQALADAKGREDKLRAALAAAERRAADWERLAKAGLPEVVQAWMDSLGPAGVKTKLRAGRRKGAKKGRK